VSNTKVVANIQTYLHAKFHIFLSPLSISSNVILTCLKDHNSKRKLNWKKGPRPFSPHRPSAAVPLGPISHVSGPLPFPVPWSLPLGAHLLVLSLPPNPPAQHLQVVGGIDSGRCHAPSHHLEPVVGVGQLMPRLRVPLCHPVPSLTEASRRPAALVDCCQGCYATMMPAPSTQRQGLAQRLSFLLPCWHRGRASSRSRPNYLGARRHRAWARPCAPRGHDQHPPRPAHHPDAGVRTKFPPLVCPSRCPLPLCLCAT
jgi:hypothetical protein